MMIIPKLRTLLITVLACLVVALVGCPPPEEKKQTTNTETNTPDKIAKPEAETKPAEDKEPSPPSATSTAIDPETYWEIQLERLQITHDTYSRMVKIYEKYKGDTEKIQEEIKKLQKQSREKMRKVFSDHGISPREFFPRGPDAREAYRKLQQYRLDHPELNEKYQELNKKISALRKKTWEYSGRKRPHRPQKGRGRHSMPTKPFLLTPESKTDEKPQPLQPDSSDRYKAPKPPMKFSSPPEKATDESGATENMEEKATENTEPGKTEGMQENIEAKEGNTQE